MNTQHEILQEIVDFCYECKQNEDVKFFEMRVYLVPRQ